MSLINQVLQDLEKRHASATELKSLPPVVRAVPGLSQSFVWKYLVAAVFIVVLAAVVFYFSGGVRILGNDRARVAADPIAAPAPAPSVPAKLAEKMPVAPPMLESPAQIITFAPVSRFSEELSLVPPPARKGQPAPTVRSKPRDASVAAEIVAPASAAKPRDTGAHPETVVTAPPAVEKPKAATVETPPKVELPKNVPVVPAGEPVVPPQPAPIAAQKSAPAAIDKQMREVTSPERAEIAFRKGVAQLQEGRAHAAEMEFQEALKQDPSHSAALQALLGLLLDSGRNSKAEQFLHKALEVNPRQPRHAMVLARLEVERGELSGAINTMVSVLPYVQSDPDFYAFLAALLQKEGRHREAIDYYRVALRGVPGNGVWMMGLGISLRAANQSAEARDAFQRAIDSRQLAPELQEFVERQLREISAPKKK